MNTKRILVVDDDKPLTQALKINLEATGDYTVLVENRSAQAIATAREFRPDVILLDYVMPGEDGGDVSAKLHSDPLLKGVPIIMVTALISNSETGERGHSQRGGHMMVAKPIRVSKLIQCIELALSGEFQGLPA
jgi:CheY-like chemotaxis protein